MLQKLTKLKSKNNTIWYYFELTIFCLSWFVVHVCGGLLNLASCQRFD